MLTNERRPTPCRRPSGNRPSNKCLVSGGRIQVTQKGYNCENFKAGGCKMKLPCPHKPTVDTRQHPCAFTNGHLKPDLWPGAPEDDKHGNRRQDTGHHCQGYEEVQRNAPREEQQHQDGQNQRLHERYQQKSLFPFHDTMPAIMFEILFYFYNY